MFNWKTGFGKRCANKSRLKLTKPYLQWLCAPSATNLSKNLKKNSDCYQLREYPRAAAAAALNRIKFTPRYLRPTCAAKPNSIQTNKKWDFQFIKRKKFCSWKDGFVAKKDKKGQDTRVQSA